MNIISNYISSIILFVSAIVGSKVFFFSLNDPEGANLLIVAVMTLTLYFSSLLAYKSNLSGSFFKKTLLGILIQIVLVSGLYFFLG